jgi:hypothetical protein
MDKLRFNLNEWHQDEAPQMQTGMRNRELRFLNDPVLIEENVDIQTSWTLWHYPLPA